MDWEEDAYLNDFDDDTDEDDEEGDICPTCGGSGEGQYDGSVCPFCHGK